MTDTNQPSTHQTYPSYYRKRGRPRKLPRGALTQIARELGVTRQLVSRVYRGKVPSARVVEAIERYIEELDHAKTG